jgi:uncharacterized repeat protein (TIGR04076 family)
MDAKIKITVLRRTRQEDLLARYATHIWEPCERLSEGQEFISEGANMPLGFCSWAWCDIQKYVLTLARGGDFIGSRPWSHCRLLQRRLCGRPDCPRVTPLGVNSASS